tara:strand:- start:1812 stop:2315 length:504 start_codon:yes stop_codon:yes gene_type:complete
MSDMHFIGDNTHVFDYLYDVIDYKSGIQQIIQPEYVLRLSNVGIKETCAVTDELEAVYGWYFNECAAPSKTSCYGFFVLYPELFEKALFVILYNYIRENKLEYVVIDMPKTQYGYVTLSDITGISLYEPSPQGRLYTSNGNLESQLSTHVDNILDDLVSLLKTIKRK